RHVRDLYEEPLVLEWVRRHTQLTFTAVLSEATALEAAHHRVGWVHEAVLADYPDLERFEVYAAGPPAMIEAMRASFPRHGLPPALLTNHDLAGILATSDEWIVSRTGIRERRISHVGLEELGYVAAARALAAAGLPGNRVELIVFGTCSHDDQVPNMASGIQVRIGAQPAAAFDINTACTSFLYGLSAATALIRTRVVRNALVIGAELISPFMDWSD